MRVPVSVRVVGLVNREYLDKNGKKAFYRELYVSAGPTEAPQQVRIPKDDVAANSDFLGLAELGWCDEADIVVDIQTMTSKGGAGTFVSWNFVGMVG